MYQSESIARDEYALCIQKASTSDHEDSINLQMDELWKFAEGQTIQKIQLRHIFFKVCLFLFFYFLSIDYIPDLTRILCYKDSYQSSQI